MQLAILASPQSWYARDLMRAGGNRHQVVVVPFTRIQSTIDSSGVCVGSGDVDLRNFDAVLVRTMPPGSLEQVVFRMDALHQLESAGCAVINPPRAIEVAVDKYLALARLKAAGFDVPRTETCQTFEEAMASFSRLGEDVVIKPLFGSEGRGITRISDPAIASRTFRLLTQLGAVIYLQEFVPHECGDLRLLVIGEEVLAIRRVNPSDWRTNISRGARAEPLVPDREYVEIAQRAAASTGALMAGVDVIPCPDGRKMVIEVNAVPGWKAISHTLSVDVAAMVLRHIQKKLLRK